MHIIIYLMWTILRHIIQFSFIGSYDWYFHIICNASDLLQEAAIGNHLFVRWITFLVKTLVD
jgi:hypothetical protein